MIRSDLSSGVTLHSDKVGLKEGLVLRLGSFEGGELGNDVVGPADGSNEGSLDGDAVGTKDGLDDGAFVGSEEGFTEGSLEA